MSKEDDVSDNIKEDTRHFVNSFCDFHRAFPDENQRIFDQIYEQIMKADKTGRIYTPSDRGQEVIWTFERHGTKIYKRVFHPGYGERPVGVDFALYKIITTNKVGVTAVQVKRNRGKPFFEFDKRDLTQRNRLARLWGSAYYLMVDETCTQPLYCFLSASELYYLIEQVGRKPPVRIPNTEVRRLCRGIAPFYDLFYGCSRGSIYVPDKYNAKIINYTRTSKRAVAEISRKTRTPEVRLVSNKI